MEAFRLLALAALVAMATADGHTMPSLEEILHMMNHEESGGMVTDPPKDSRLYHPLVHDPHLVAHVDFLVGSFKMANKYMCKDDNCRRLAEYWTKLILEYNSKVLELMDKQYPLDEYRYHMYPLHLESISVLTITVVHRNPPNFTTTQRPSTTRDPSQPTDRPTVTPSPTDRPTTKAATTAPTARPTSPTTTRASTTRASAGPGSYYCSFEEANDPFCGAEQDTSDNFDWTRHTGETGSDGTGPSEAHSGDYYMYIESSSPRNPQDVARLITSVETPGTYCARFYTYMVGMHTGFLNVTAIDDNRNERVVWSKFREEKDSDGNQVTEWVPRAVEVTLQQGEAIAFVAVRWDEYQGDTSIDDVAIDSNMQECEGN